MNAPKNKDTNKEVDEIMHESLECTAWSAYFDNVVLFIM